MKCKGGTAGRFEFTCGSGSVQRYRYRIDSSETYVHEAQNEAPNDARSSAVHACAASTADIATPTSQTPRCVRWDLAGTIECVTLA